MANKPLSRQAKNYVEEKSPQPPAKKVVAKLPEKAATTAAPQPQKAATTTAPQEKVVPPVVKAKPVKPKKVRFVREKKEKKPQTNAAPLPPRSTKAAAKIMSKKLAIPPQAEPNFGTKPKP